MSNLPAYDDTRVIHAERLLNVARACRESPHPEQFTMSCHMHKCGTPACAFGHYAARTDLQNAFKLCKPEYFKCDSGEIVIHDYQGVETLDGIQVSFDDEAVGKHFGLTEEELNQLFSAEGCGNAKSAIEAAEYIERFVEEHRG